jgi:hypothetical protein
MDKYREIYAQLEALSEPASLPALWRDIPAPPAYRSPIRNFRIVAARLRKDFRDDELISAGVFIRIDSGHEGGARSENGVHAAASPRLMFNLQLLLGNWLLLRRAPDEAPFDIVVRGGCLSQKQPPVLAALQDAMINKFLRESGDTLLVTLTLDDAAALWSIGFPAIPAVGIDSLDGNNFEKFCRRFDIRALGGSWDDDDYEYGGDQYDGNEVCVEETYSQNKSHQPPTSSSPAVGDNAASPDRPSGVPHAPQSPRAAAKNGASPSASRVDLSFVAWHPALLSMAAPGKLANIRSHFRALADGLDLLMDQLYVWEPVPELMVKLRFAVEKGFPKRLKRLIITSESDSTHQLFPIVSRS